MKNKKGFTLIELLGVIIILGILVSLAVGSYSSYLTKSRTKTYMIEEKSMLSAVKEAYVDCSSNHPNNEFCKNHKGVDTKGDFEIVYLKELIDDHYIDKIKNPYNTEEFCDFDKSYVKVSSNQDSNQTNNSDITYTVCLICGNKKSKDCSD